MSRKVMLILVVALLAVNAFVFAQEETDYEARYEGIPANRLEDGGFVLGDPEAPLTVVEFADFMCPHCQNYQETAHQFIDEYVRTGQAKFEYRMFPVVNPTYSNLTAQLAECADEQREGAFWPAHDVLYDLAKAGNVGPDTTETLAATLELDAEALATCAETADQYQIDAEVGGAVGVSGTPATLVRNAEGELGWVRLDGRTFSGGGVPFEMLVQVMEAENIDEVVVVPQPVFKDFFLTEEEITEETTCVAPCWNGITPGTTTFEEAVAIIEGSTQTVEPQTVEDPNSDAKMIQWATVASGASNRLITNDGTEVSSMTLVSPAEVKTGVVIEAFGEPTSALASETGQGALVVSLVYPDKSLIVAAYVLPGEDGSYEFSAESDVLGVNMFSPAEFEAVLASATVYDWAGYEALDSYLGK